MPRPTNTTLSQEARYREEGAKTCRKCGKVLALSHFGKCAKTRDGLQTECKPCVNSRNRTYAENRTEAQKARRRDEQRRRRALRPEVTAQQNKRANAKRYGLTVEEYDYQMSLGCAICGEEAQAMDHCHSTGRTRGALCDRCNHGLGHFKDDPERLAAAIFYLLR